MRPESWDWDNFIKSNFEKKLQSSIPSNLILKDGIKKNLIKKNEC